MDHQVGRNGLRLQLAEGSPAARSNIPCSRTEPSSHKVYESILWVLWDAGRALPD